MSSPGAGTESPNFLPLKYTVFSSKQAGEDTAPPLHGVCVIYISDSNSMVQTVRQTEIGISPIMGVSPSIPIRGGATPTLFNITYNLSLRAETTAR